MIGALRPKTKGNNDFALSPPIYVEKARVTRSPKLTSRFER